MASTDHAALVAALALIRPGATYAIRGDTIEWLDAGQADPTPAEIDAALVDVARRARIADAWAEAERRCENGAVTVATSAGSHLYGIDRGTQDNVMKALAGVLAGLTPDPRPWTPKGAASPVMLSHADIKLVAAAIGGAYDALVQAYLVHKGSILALADAGAIAAYDVTAGWPAY